MTPTRHNTTRVHVPLPRLGMTYHDSNMTQPDTRRYHYHAFTTESGLSAHGRAEARRLKRDRATSDWPVTRAVLTRLRSGQRHIYTGQPVKKCATSLQAGQAAAAGGGDDGRRRVRLRRRGAALQRLGRLLRGRPGSSSLFLFGRSSSVVLLRSFIGRSSAACSHVCKLQNSSTNSAQLK